MTIKSVLISLVIVFLALIFIRAVFEVQDDQVQVIHIGVESED